MDCKSCSCSKLWRAQWPLLSCPALCMVTSILPHSVPDYSSYGSTIWSNIILMDRLILSLAILYSTFLSVSFFCFLCLCSLSLLFLQFPLSLYSLLCTAVAFLSSSLYYDYWMCPLFSAQLFSHVYIHKYSDHRFLPRTATVTKQHSGIGFTKTFYLLLYTLIYFMSMLSGN